MSAWGRSGAVFALEASRLGRSCADWYRPHGVLLLDQHPDHRRGWLLQYGQFQRPPLPGPEGNYVPGGTSFHVPPPPGRQTQQGQERVSSAFLCPWVLSTIAEGRTVIDPDQQVQGAVRLLFATFRQTGSAYGVVHDFAKKAIQFPKRAYGGIWNGRLIWGRLAEGRVRMILKNPAYAGVYVFGRFGAANRSPRRQIHSKITAVPMASWTVTIPDHHEAYISWEEFLQNQTILLRNLTLCRGEHLDRSGERRLGPPARTAALRQLRPAADHPLPGQRRHISHL